MNCLQLTDISVTLVAHCRGFLVCFECFDYYSFSIAYIGDSHGRSSNQRLFWVFSVLTSGIIFDTIISGKGGGGDMKGSKPVDCKKKVTRANSQECAECFPGRFRGINKYVRLH